MLERLTRATPPMLNKRGTELISQLKTNMLKIENAERENITATMLRFSEKHKTAERNE